MNSRSRFAAAMRGDRVDRLPFLEDSFSDEFLEKLKGMELDFPSDRVEDISLNLDPVPPFEGKAAWEMDLPELRRRLDAEDPARLPGQWREKTAAWSGREHILKFTIHRGLFLSLGIGDWRGLEAGLEAICERPGRIWDVMAVFGDFAARLAARVLDEVEVDMVCFSEPIAGGGGPLVSPAAYERLALKSYVPILEILRARKVETIALVAWADTRILLPKVLASGFNCLWAQETHGPEMDYRNLRKEFGGELRLIGGLDLDNLLKGRTGISQEVETKLAALLPQGRYIPAADGRVRAGMPPENYVYFRRLLADKAAEYGLRARESAGDLT